MGSTATTLGEFLVAEPRAEWLLRSYGLEPDADDIELTLAGFCRIRGVDVHLFLAELESMGDLDDDESTLELPEVSGPID